MILVALPLADTVTASMIGVVEAEVMAAMTLTAIAVLVVTIVVIGAMAAVIATTDTLIVALTAMLDVMTAIAAAAEMSDAAAVEEDTLIAMTELAIATVDAHPEMLLPLPPMVTQLLVEKLGSHTEVETMMRDIPVVVIDR